MSQTQPTTKETSTEVTKTPKEKFISLVKSEKLAQQMQASIADADPGFVRQCVALTLNAASKNTKLYSCTLQSVMKSMLDCCSLGILPNGVDSHLIPYGTECQLLIDYKGMITLAIKSERISKVDAEIFCKGDRFTWHNGEIDHIIDWLADDRGEMAGAYAVATFKDGTKASAVMTKKEIDGIRNRSRSKNNGPWVTDYAEMCKKTVVRRLSKRLPLSPAAIAAIEYDDKQNFDFVDATVSTAKPKQSVDALADAFEAAQTQEPETEVVDAE